MKPKYKIRPSTLALNLVCPASALLPAIQVETSKPFAERGNVLHEFASKTIKAIDNGDQLPSYGEIENITDKERALLDFYTRNCSDFYTEVPLSTECFYSHLFDNERALFEISDCTADAVIVGKKINRIVDLKTGTQYVEVEDNPQLLSYAVALCYSPMRLMSNQVGSTPVEIGIVQTVCDEPQYTTQRLDNEVMRLHLVKIRDLVTQLASTSRPRCVINPGCQWCQRYHECEAHGKQVLPDVPADDLESWMIANRETVSNLDNIIK